MAESRFEVKRTSSSKRSDRAFSYGWKALVISACWFIFLGANFALVWFQLTPGPYSMGENYPTGDYLHSMVSSFAFSYIAFGAIMLAVAWKGRGLTSRAIWIGLLAGWILNIFPHALIAVAFVLQDPSIIIAQYPLTLLVLAWFGPGILGFVLTSRSGTRREQSSTPKTLVEVRQITRLGEFSQSTQKENPDPVEKRMPGGRVGVNLN